jgi:small GTP-binding protein
MEDQESDKPKSANQIKIIVVGSMAVGKTCLIAHYQTGKFLSEIPSTCGSSFVQIKKVIKGKKYTLNLWDTAGQEKYDSLTKIFTKNANIVILVYSIVDKKSFQSLNKWLKLVKEINGEDGYALGVAANKCDLYQKIVVPNSAGQDFAKKNNAIWKETSAKEDQRGIEELIDELLERYLVIKTNSTNPEYIKLNNNKENKKEGGCCKGKGNNTKNNKNNEVVGRDNRINSKISTISQEENNNNNNNKDDDEDF